MSGNGAWYVLFPLFDEIFVRSDGSLPPWESIDCSVFSDASLWSTHLSDSVLEVEGLLVNLRLQQQINDKSREFPETPFLPPPLLERKYPSLFSDSPSSIPSSSSLPPGDLQGYIVSAGRSNLYSVLGVREDRDWAEELRKIRKSRRERNEKGEKQMKGGRGERKRKSQEEEGIDGEECVEERDHRGRGEGCLLVGSREETREREEVEEEGVREGEDGKENKTLRDTEGTRSSKEYTEVRETSSASSSTSSSSSSSSSSLSRRRLKFINPTEERVRALRARREEEKEKEREQEGEKEREKEGHEKRDEEIDLVLDVFRLSPSFEFEALIGKKEMYSKILPPTTSLTSPSSMTSTSSCCCSCGACSLSLSLLAPPDSFESRFDARHYHNFLTCLLPPSPCPFPSLPPPPSLEKEPNSTTISHSPLTSTLPISPFPLGRAKWRFIGFSFPSFLFRLMSLLMAQEARERIEGWVRSEEEGEEQEVTISHPWPQIPLPLLLEALTPLRCTDSFDSERLETLGDGLLKAVSSLEVYLSHEGDEGELARERGRFIRNRVLGEIAMGKGTKSSITSPSPSSLSVPLSHYLRAQSMSQGNQNLSLAPPGLTACELLSVKGRDPTPFIPIPSPTTPPSSSSSTLLSFWDVEDSNKLKSIQKAVKKIYPSPQYDLWTSSPPSSEDKDKNQDEDEELTLNESPIDGQPPKIQSPPPPKALADLVEAVLGVIFLSGGLTRTHQTEGKGEGEGEGEGSEDSQTMRLELKRMWEAGRRAVRAMVIHPVRRMDPTDTPFSSVSSLPTSPGSSDSIPISLEGELVQRVEGITGYRFNSPSLLTLALTHCSVSASPSENNERLEWLGDAVLDLAVLTRLFLSSQSTPSIPSPSSSSGESDQSSLTPSSIPPSASRAVQGFLSEEKSRLTRNTQLIRVGLELGLEALMIRNPQDIASNSETSGRKRGSKGRGNLPPELAPHKWLGDVVEALLGAVFLDSQCCLYSVLCVGERIGLI